MFRLSDNVPTNHIHLFLNSSSTPDKIPLSYVNEFMDFTRKADELHDMIWNATKASLGKGSFTSHVEEFGFPPNKPGIHIIQNKLKMS